jgi:hypothetical protein
MVIEEMYMYEGQRSSLNRDFLRAQGLVGIEEKKGVAYAARALSTVPVRSRAKLDREFNAFVEILREAGWEARVPFLLGPGDDLNKVNPRNHRHMAEAILNTPFMPFASDGRGWEHGFTYLRKGVVPLVNRNQKINIPSIRIPFQVPLVYDNFKGAERDRLGEFFGALKEYDFGTGRCWDHGDTLVGIKGQMVNRKFDCLRCVAEGYGIEVVPVRIE